MKEILAINASPRKKNTAAMIAAVASVLEQESMRVTTIELKDYETFSCTGCHRCINGHECHLRDRVEELKKLMIDVDGIIIASPVYMTGMPGTLKSLIDRTADWFHRPQLVGKPLLAVVSTAGSYAASTAGEIRKIAMHWACAPAGAWTRTAWQTVDMQAARRSRPIGRFIEMVRTGPRSYRPGWKHLYLFVLQKVLARNVLELDRVFWKEKGWFESDFFFRCRTGVVKPLFFRLLYGILARVIVPKDSEE